MCPASDIAALVDMDQKSQCLPDSGLLPHAGASLANAPARALCSGRRPLQAVAHAFPLGRGRWCLDPDQLDVVGIEFAQGRKQRQKQKGRGFPAFLLADMNERQNLATSPML